MASLLNPPVDELNIIFRGDVDIFNGYSAFNGDGSLYIRNGGLYVEGLTDLDQTTITTTDGKFHVLGPNKIEFDISGGLTSSVEITAEDASFFKTTAGTLNVEATAVDANGKINILAAGTGPDSVLVNAQNTTNGQVSVVSAGASQVLDAIKITATDTAGGNVLIQGSGDFSSSVPSIKLFADNTVSGQILLESAGDDAGSDAVLVKATGTVGGNVQIVAAGSTVPAILADATNAEGKILVRSAGNATGENAIELFATGATEGNILVRADGGSTNAPSVKILAENTSSGKILVESNGNIPDAVRILADNATAGGIDVDATGLIAIDTTSVSQGITIATATEGVPVTIGTLTSLTTIAGDLTVQGTTTTVNTETLVVEDNLILLNSGNGELGMDSGLVVRRHQTVNNLGTGDVVAGPVPIQESGQFRTGSSTPGTLVLDLHASLTDDFYNGWWIKITSGTGINQVRRIKDYVGATGTATIHVTADNTEAFYDGLDLVTAPASGDSYNLYSDVHQATFYNETSDNWTFANLARNPDPASEPGVSKAMIQNYQQVDTGSLTVYPQVYRNAYGVATGTSVEFTLLNHGAIVGDMVKISDSRDFTPSIPSGNYVVTTVPGVNTFTISVLATTTSVDTSSVTLTMQETSFLAANVIRSQDPGITINFPDLTSYQDITIPKTSTAYFFVNLATNTYGALMVFISDLESSGSMGVFAAARSSSVGNGTVSRLASAKGEDGQRIDADWLSGEVLKIRQKPAGVGAGNYTYRVRVYYTVKPY